MAEYAKLVRKSSFVFRSLGEGDPSCEPRLLASDFDILPDMVKCKAVVFDLNGVFLHSEYLSKRIHDKYGVSEDKFIDALKEVMNIVRMPGVNDSFEIWKPHLKKLGLDIERETFFNFWFRGEKLVPELLEYARELKTMGVKVFILSNNFKERTEYYRESFPEIFSSVDKAYFSWETGFVKPDKEAFENVLKENKLKPNEYVYFDDSSKNIEVAENLGIRAQKYRGLQETRIFVERNCG